MIYKFGVFQFDDDLLELRQEGRAVRLETPVKRLLAALLRRAGDLVTKEELVDEVWEKRVVADNSLTVAMARLRKILHNANSEDEFVVTLYRRGYRFVGAVKVAPAPCLDTTSPLESSPVAAELAHSLPPVVGRGRVLDRLHGALADASAGRGRVCALGGEPGIGKTFVVEAFHQQLSNAPVQVAWGFCREAGDTPPLWPWLRLLQQVSVSSPAAQTASGGVLEELLERLEGRKRWEGVDHIDFGGSRRHHYFEAIVRAFLCASVDVPWVLILDDLHRADGASLELLGQLIDEIAHTRILIVATLRNAPGRPAPCPDTHLPYVLAHRNCERITLERLGEAEVLAYVASATDDPDPQLGKAVFARSEGNPFFMTELTRQLCGRGGEAADSLSVSGIALDSIRQRIGTLGSEAHDVLVAAAVIGRTFELPLLQAVTGRGWGALMACLEDAIATDIIVAAPGSTTAFAFGHDLMRAALYDGLALAERRRWHIRIAEALERRLSMGNTVPPSELAYHLYSGLPESDLRKTVHYCRAASEAAATVFANADLVRYLRHALQALDLMRNPSVRLRLSLWYAITVYGRGQPSIDYADALDEVIRLAHAQANGVMMVRAAIMFNAYPGFKPMPGARMALERALDLLPPEVPSARSVALSALICTAPLCYDRAKVQASLDESMALARRGRSRAALYVALIAQLYAQGGPAHDAQAEAAERELEELFRLNPTPQMLLVPLYVALHRSVYALQCGDTTRMAAAIERGFTHAREIHNSLQWHFERWRLIAMINTGQWSNAIPKLVAHHRQAKQPALLGAEPFLAFDRIVLISQAVDQLPMLDDALRSALDYDVTDPPCIWAMKVRTLAALGLHNEARGALCALTPRDLAKLPCDSQYLGTLGHLTRATIQLGASEYAEALGPLLAPYANHFAAHYSFLCDGSVSQLLGMLTAALGRNEEAIPLLECGIAMNERAGFVSCAAEARLRLAQCLLPREERRARDHAREAGAIARRIGMSSMAREAEALDQQVRPASRL